MRCGTVIAFALLRVNGKFNISTSAVLVHVVAKLNSTLPCVCMQAGANSHTRFCVHRSNTASNCYLTLLKPQSNRPSYSNTVIGTLTVDGWAVTFGTARWGLGGTAARPGPSSMYQM